MEVSFLNEKSLYLIQYSPPDMGVSSQATPWLLWPTWPDRKANSCGSSQNIMTKRETKKSDSKALPARNNGNGKDKRSRRRADANTDLTGNVKLIEQVRQIIAKTPEIRPEKMGPLQEAVAQGSYSIDVRKLANILIVKLFLDY